MPVRNGCQAISPCIIASRSTEMTPAYSTVACHVAADLLQIGARGGGLVHDSTSLMTKMRSAKANTSSRSALTKSTAAPALRAAHDARPNFGHRREIQAKTRVGHDQEPYLAGQLTGQHRALHVATG